MLDHEVEPAVDAGPRIEMVQEFALPAEDGVGGDVDDGADEVISVLEVVVELAAACSGACTDVVEAHACGALLDDQLRRGFQDPLARRTPLRRCRCVCVRHTPMVSEMDLTVQSRLVSLDCPVQSMGA